MEIKRKPFQGVLNIIRFNWHFYLIAGITIFFLLLIKDRFSEQTQSIAFFFCCLAILTMTTSTLVSLFVYDLSSLYQFNWLPNLDFKKTLNINAGFDETSEIIKTKFRHTELTICDFYHPDKHTEVSIKRAREAYPPLKNTIQVATDKLPFQNHTFDYAFAILSAHEIRDEQERIMFFKELNRITKLTGQIYVTEHLRDINNFLAYTIGFFHFHSKSTWKKAFFNSGHIVTKEIKITPFITTFILEKNGNTL